MSTAHELLAKAVVAKAATELAGLDLPADLTDAEAVELATWALLGGLRGAVDRLRTPEFGDYVRFKDAKGVERVGRIYGFDDGRQFATVVAPPRGRGFFDGWNIPLTRATLAKVEPTVEQVEAITKAEAARVAAYRKSNGY